MRKSLIIILLLSLLQPAFAQSDTLRLAFSAAGRVCDAASGKAIESVVVSVPGKNFATVTNADGDFTIRSDSRIGELEFHYLGYKTLRVPAAKEMKVRMQRNNIVLESASIVAADPKSVLEAALDRVSDYYCPKPELLECFYRETVRKRTRYIYVAEAVARIYKHKWDGSVYRDAAALEKSRTLVSTRKRDTLGVKTQGGPLQAISHDLIKNINLIFDREDLRLYRFEMGAPEYIGDRIQFVIKMHPLITEDADYPLYDGVIYIDRELLCFTRIEVSMDMSDKSKATRVILVSKPSGLRFTPLEVSLVMNYRIDEGQSRLEYFRSTMRFACDWKKKLFKTQYTTVNEMVVTDLREPAVPIPHSERFRFSESLRDCAPQFSDPDFWEGYNIIEPSESLEHAIERLKK